MMMMRYTINALSLELLDTCDPFWLDAHYEQPCDDSYDHRIPQIGDFEEIEDDDDCPF